MRVNGGSKTKRDGIPPIYDLEQEVRGGTRINVERFDRMHDRALAGSHGHRSLELLYFEEGGGTHRVGSRSWEVSAGDLFLISPGEVHDVGDIGDAWGWAVEFSADAIGEPSGASALLSCYANPLLYPFVRPSGGEWADRFSVPEEARPEWGRRLSTLHHELEIRRAGYHPAARAYLVLILVEIARLAEDVIGGMRARNDPVLAEVFAYIERSYQEPISLKDVAATVNLSPGHLTTVTRERTGRTVVEWIAERRMAEARKLLVETDESVENVGTRVGYKDPAYFTRRFRDANGKPPTVWRLDNRF